MEELLKLLRDGALVIQTPEPRRRGEERVAVTMLCGDGRFVQIVRRDAATAHPAELAQHRREVGVRLAALSRTLGWLRGILYGTALLASVAVFIATWDPRDTVRAVVGSVVSGLAGTLGYWIARRALKRYLERRLGITP